MPFIPRHLIKLFADCKSRAPSRSTSTSSASRAAFARGNENNLHEPDGTYYLGDGTSPRLRRRQPRRALQRDAVAADHRPDQQPVRPAVLHRGATRSVGFTDSGTFIARPLPPIDGEFPVRHSTFYAPGAPIRGWMGTRLTF